AGLVEFIPGASDHGGWFRRVERGDGRRTGAINGFAESRDGSIRCASGVGLLRLTHTGRGDRIEEVEIGLPRTSENDQIVRAVLEDEDGTLWVGAGSGLYARGADAQTTRLTVNDGLPVNEVWALALDGSRQLWAATRQGLVLIDRHG